MHRIHRIFRRRAGIILFFKAFLDECRIGKRRRINASYFTDKVIDNRLIANNYFRIEKDNRISAIFRLNSIGIKKLVQEKSNLNIGAYMGLVMSKHRGKVEGKKIMEMLKKHIK